MWDDTIDAAGIQHLSQSWANSNQSKQTNKQRRKAQSTKQGKHCEQAEFKHLLSAAATSCINYYRTANAIARPVTVPPRPLSIPAPALFFRGKKGEQPCCANDKCLLLVFHSNYFGATGSINFTVLLDVS